MKIQRTIISTMMILLLAVTSLFSAKAQGQKQMASRKHTFAITELPRQISASGLVKVTIRPGRTAQVEAQGNPRAMEDYSVRMQGNTLIIEGHQEKDEDRDGEERRKKRIPSAKYVYVTITLPSYTQLEELEATGLTEVVVEEKWQSRQPVSIEVSGLSEIVAHLIAPEVRLEVSGISKLTLSADTKLLKVDVEGLSRCTLNGTADTLHADVEGISKLVASGLRARNGKIDVGGLSRARVNVTDHLTTDISGASSFRNIGDARRR